MVPMEYDNFENLYSKLAERRPPFLLFRLNPTDLTIQTCTALTINGLCVFSIYPRRVLPKAPRRPGTVKTRKRKTTL